MKGSMHVPSPPVNWVQKYALGTHWDRVHSAFRYADYAAVAALVLFAAWLVLRMRRATVRRSHTSRRVPPFRNRTGG